MKHPFRSLTLLAAVILLAAAPRAAGTETLVLDGDDVSDWVRVLDSSAWKYSDACLSPISLMKFDLDWNWPVIEVTGARLELFVEKAEPGSSIELWHVLDDRWSYAWWEPDTLRNWPAVGSLGVFDFSDTASFSVDVTRHIQEELLAGDSVFSIKITGDYYPDTRVSSPLAPIQRMRPRIVVDFVGPLLVPPLPDLAISTADLRFFPMRPAPGQPVTIEAWIRNIGPGPAADVEVSFWDGEPGRGTPIGSAVVPRVEAGGGTALASVRWPAERGLRDIHVVVDPDHEVQETDEANNADFRCFLVTDPGPDPDVSASMESFEYPGLSLWHSDFDVPKQFGGFGPKSFDVNRSGAEAHHGRHSMELYLDGTADDGTIWLETALPAEPYSRVDVEVSFQLFRYAPDIAFQPVVSVGPLDPEREFDFTVLTKPAEEGWVEHSYKKTVLTGPYDMIHVAVGLTVTWETPGTFYLDRIAVRATHPPVAGVDPPESVRDRTGALMQNRPNPMGPRTTIAYRLERPGWVSLRIFDMAGRLVSTLRQGPEEAGLHEVPWDGTDRAGRRMPPGLYFYRLDGPDLTDSRKLLLAR